MILLHYISGASHLSFVDYHELSDFEVLLCSLLVVATKCWGEDGSTRNIVMWLALSFPEFGIGFGDRLS